MKNVRKHRGIKHGTTKRKINYLVTKPNCCNTKFFTEDFLAIEMKKNSNIHE